LPGVIAGSVIRVKLLPGPRVFDVVVAAVLIPVGVWLLVSRPARTDAPSRPATQIPVSLLVVLAVVVGCVGGIYGIGGGAILAPILIGSGMRLRRWTSSCRYRSRRSRSLRLVPGQTTLRTGRHLAHGMTTVTGHEVGKWSFRA
jgi:Sulfite exporter TauE/SafE